MSVFQILILIFITIVIVRSIIKWRKKEISAWLLSLWIIFWIFISFIDIFPQVINKLADLVGVGRGVDLVMYIAIFCLFYYIFRFNIRISTINKKLSEIVRKNAINNAQKNKPEKYE